jgi:hypothetical protein
MRPQTFRAAFAGLAASCLLAGCSWLHDTFSSSVDAKTAEKIHGAIPIGTTMVAAEARLSSQGFDCGNRTGNFTDELGRNRSAPGFMLCVRRAAKLSFACENRDEVVVVPSGGVVDEVDVVRGANCDRQPGPALIAPNAS